MTDLAWLELEVRAPSERGPYLEAALEGTGFEGWVVESQEPEAVLVLYLAREGDWETRFTRLREAVTAQGGLLSRRGVVRDEDWAENWKAFYHPFRVGRRLLVCPSWELEEPAPGEARIVLDPGAAFGTGYHETTRLCLELLELCVSDLAPSAGLDYGTGSGILAIACLKLGVDSVVAVDFDPVAVRVARENVALNQVEERAEVIEANRPPPGAFPLVTANLTAATLSRLAPELAGAVAPGGRLVAGGIIAERALEVQRAFEELGLTLCQRREAGDWVALVFSRP